MPDNTSNDVYDDPDNILAERSSGVDGSVELPADEIDDPSQSILVPERGQDERGRIDELEEPPEGDAEVEMTDGHLEDTDGDSTRLGDMDPSDEKDGEA